MENRELIMKEMQAVAPMNKEKAEVIAEKYGVKWRSVVAMATRNEIPYERKARVAKDGSAVVSKADLVSKIAEALDMDSAKLDSLDKANKTALSNLFYAVKD